MLLGFRTLLGHVQGDKKRPVSAGAVHDRSQHLSKLRHVLLRIEPPGLEGV